MFSECHFVNRQKASPAEMNLALCHVLSGVSLHNIKGHIENVLDELKYHLEKDQRQQYEDAYEAAIGDKDALRGSDLRLELILMTVNLQGKMPPRVLELLQLLAKISHLLYLPARMRFPKTVFRLYNIVFKHSIMSCLIIRSQKNTTFERFYGKYFHALSSHTVQIMRVVSPNLTDAEEEERTFNFIKGIRKATSSGLSKEVIDNMQVHIQAELQARQNHPFAAQRQDSNISRSSAALPKERNTVFTAGFIYKFKDAFQAHQERT